MYSIGEFARLVGVSVTTLRRWEKSGKLIARRHPSGRKYFDATHLHQLGISATHDKRIVAYCRVSSPSQRDDLQSQVKFVMSHGYSFDEVIEEIGGGMNMKRPKFRKLIAEIISGSVGTIVIAHKDRVMRFGFDLFAYLCETSGTEIVVLSESEMSPEAEVVQDLMTIIHTFSCRLYGLRKYKREIENAISAQDTTETE